MDAYYVISSFSLFSGYHYKGKVDNARWKYLMPIIYLHDTLIVYLDQSKGKQIKFSQYKMTVWDAFTTTA
jgi:hypothetical protein